jgi:hypothetical protein
MNPVPMTTPVMRSPVNPMNFQTPLDRLLDIRLLAEPRVRDFYRSSHHDSLFFSSVSPPGSITRIVRLIDRILTVMAMPESADFIPQLRRKLSRNSPRSDVLIVNEVWLRKRPHIDNAELIAASSGFSVSPLSRVLISEHLTESGGSSNLADCAARVSGADDPVQAVLALAAAKAVSIDISRPIGPLTQVSLPPSR